MQRIVAPTAAAIGAIAAATAAAMITLLLTTPSATSVQPTAESDVLALLQDVLVMLAEAAWTVLRAL
jgi:hypothetical protein